MLATTCHALRKRLPFVPTNSSAGTPPLERTRLCALQPLDAALLLRTPKLQCKSEHLRWDRPDLNCEPQQARGIPRNFQVDETVAAVFWVR
jgi:hypothetical protein